MSQAPTPEDRRASRCAGEVRDRGRPRPPGSTAWPREVMEARGDTALTAQCLLEVPPGRWMPGMRAGLRTWLSACEGCPR